ncbi:putative Mg2+ transporter-C (MgtC) family protein [Clostridium sp. DSM 8431]|uniref:MgtC/SapB family protein n=1 Tax=Clostridium sp. DSM 8431 TaxID=1761781 RepID=UPI0008E58F99|nr:MgtC/SapB family protein [Clostridium sp. DSM 8431]SFU45564.1 putative Mg2+ transporter-C (MgtC) family protein [Clostridium sp. DSM 8431]
MDTLMELSDYLKELNAVSIIVRLLMAVICGGVVGIERGRKGQAAGCRTHMLVCLGATSVMMTNIYAISEFNASSDPTRIGAQVVSGIGFLGAGTILVTSKNQIRGLTTAAGLWASACMGLAIGIGFYELAIIGIIFIFGVIAVINKFDKRVYGISKVMDVYIEFLKPEVLREVICFLREKNIKILSIQVVKDKTLDKSRSGAIIGIKTKERFDHSDVIAEFWEIEGIEFVEEV